MNADTATRLPERLESTVSDLEALADRTERIEALIALAGSFREVPAAIATRPFPAEHRVAGCESEAYVWSEPLADGTLRFHFAVENPQGISAKAMAALLERTVSGAPLVEVARLPTEVVYRVFGHELSMGKSMGLMGMIQSVQREAARALAARQAG
ncbi:MAG: SufE family protein [Thermoanaerobaculia bacterium]